MNKTYKPNPIDTTDIVIPAEISELVDSLAINTHDNWAQNRITSGWKYGEERNDVLKETPCLVKYEELPEEEKIYDRVTVEETIKVILKLGYKIIKECK